jgi:predicted lipid-binding transport protein (Tim44 family)
MIRRPDLLKAVFVAGILWLVTVQPALPRDQGGTGASSSHRTYTALANPGSASQSLQHPKSSFIHQKETASAAAETPLPPQPIHNLVRLLAGGVLAGLLWSALFGYPYYSYLPDSPWPLGLLDLSAILAFFYLAYLFLKSVSQNGRNRRPERPSFLDLINSGPARLTVREEAEPGLNEIAAADPDFDLAAFGDFAYGVINDLHAAWNRQDLDSLKGAVGEDLLGYLHMGIKIMNLREEISRLEDLCLNRLVVFAAGSEKEGEFITLLIEGQVMDYILHKSSHKLLSGSLTYPIDLRESWRFERVGGQGPWKLADIQDS